MKSAGSSQDKDVPDVPGTKLREASIQAERGEFGRDLDHSRRRTVGQTILRFTEGAHGRPGEAEAHPGEDLCRPHTLNE